MGIQWKIPFKSLDGTDYVINIFSDNYTGSPIILQGGARPFVTEEDNNEDILYPIRTQSGYINVVTDRGTWLSIITIGSLVTLTVANSVKWNGYISKQAFHGDAFELIKEYQIPVHCMLTQLQSKKFIVSPYNMPTFAKILVEGFSSLPSVGRPTSILWQSVIADNQGMPNFLEHRFQRANFMKSIETPDEEITAESESTYFDVISEICKYFGIILCSQGKELLFMTPNVCNLCYRNTMQDVSEIETDGINALKEVIRVATIAPALSSLQYMDNSNQEEVLPPVHGVKIAGKINLYEDFDGTYPKATVDNYVNKHETSVWHQDITSKNIRIYTREFVRDTHIGEYSHGYYQVWEQYKNDFVTMKLYGYENGSGEGMSHGSHIISRDETSLDELSDKIDYHWENLLYVMASTVVNRPILGLYGNRNVSLKANSGAINIYYESRDVIVNTFGRRLVWRLSVGEFYWNGTVWLKSPTTFSIGWRGEEEIKECQTNRSLNDKYNGKKGMIIPVPIDMHGQIVLELMQTETGGTSGEYVLKNLELSYIRPDDKKLDDDLPTEVVEEDTLSINSVEDYSQECAFATSPTSNGYGTALGFEGSAIDHYVYESDIMRPEYFRLNCIKRRRNMPLSVLSINVKDSDSISNRYEYIGKSSWSAYSILSADHDWRDDLLKLKLVEIKI